MAWTTALFRFDEGRRIGGERTAGGVESIDKQFVYAKIGNDGKPVVRRNVDRMRMGLRLEGRVFSMTDVLHERGLLAEGTIFFNAQHRDTAAAEICHQYITPGLVDGQVACARPAGRQGVQQMQLAGCVINGERAYVRRVIEVRPQ